MNKTKKSNFFRTLQNLLRTLCMYLSWIIVQPFFLILLYPLTFLPKSIRYDNRLYFFLTNLMAKLFIWPAALDIHYSGLENISHHKSHPAIFIANHTSALDIPLIEALLGSFPRVWICKEEYKKIPLFGRLVSIMHVTVQRESPRKALQALLTAIARVQEKNRHLVIFPEGTRHSSGKLGDFKEGFAIAAEKLNRPIIPIACYGLYKVFPKGSIMCHSFNNPVYVHIGQPMSLKPNESRQEFVTRVHEWFQETLDNSRTSR